jgi:6-phosphogluconolactonase
MSSADVLVANSQAHVANVLCQSIVSIARDCLQTQASFTIAISSSTITRNASSAADSSSSSSWIAKLSQAFADAHVNPQWSQWHVFVADEQVLLGTANGSHIRLLQDALLQWTSIPVAHIYTLNSDLVQQYQGDATNTNITGSDESPSPSLVLDAIARDYQATLQRVLTEHSSSSVPHPTDGTLGPFLDLAVVGFGAADGHTCGLFPTDHPVLAEDSKWVAASTSSTSTSSTSSNTGTARSITLTFTFLNQHTRHIIVCGSGMDKRSIVGQVFSPHEIYPLHVLHEDSNNQDDVSTNAAAAYYSAMISTTPPPPFPCAMLHPQQSLTWILDADAIPPTFGLLSNVIADVIVALPETAGAGAGAGAGGVAQELCRQIVTLCREAIQERGIFTIAMSGGSDNTFEIMRLLSKLPQAFQDANVLPHWSQWHVLLTDERGVPDSHVDSNMRALHRYLLNQPGVTIPPRQVHGVDNVSLGESIQATAMNYQTQVLSVLERCGPDGLLDVALLGLGADDGHTCSLFPNHPLLQERHDYVGALTDAPLGKQANQITFTLRLLNDHCRNVIFCGTGDSKSSILHEILQGTYHDAESDNDIDNDTGRQLLKANIYPKYPCGMVRPKDKLVYIVDPAAMTQVFVALSKATAGHDEETNTGPKLIARRGSSVLPVAPTATLAKVYVRPTKQQVGEELLCAQIVRYCSMAIAERNAFTIALSGGSLPQMLSKLALTFEALGVDPHWDKWHVVLADERCVPEDHVDSNMHALRRYFLQDVYEQIPHQHIYGLDQVSVAESSDVAARDYERKVHTALTASGGMLDLAVLGFGPDGHTCSLFPGHKLLQEHKRWVAPITDSPKPPSHRVTLTLPFLNEHTRNVIFCGTGDSKGPVLQDIFKPNTLKAKGLHYETELTPKYPCSMIRPQNDLVYLVDSSAMEHILLPPLPPAQYAKVLIAKNKDDVPHRLLPLLVQQSQRAIRDRGIFVIALSGGSLPQMLSKLADTFRHLSVDPHWDKWHVLLADERCVPTSDEDSNLGSIQSHLLDFCHIPKSQIYGIDESKLDYSTEVQARDYEQKVRSVLAKSNGMLDVALLGFGPDGHTCSLFPDHPQQLDERTRWVIGIEDSPKPPPRRITLTLGLLNECARTVIFVGAGATKEPVLNQVFERLEGRQGADAYVKIQTNPPPFPCAMVTPQTHLVWVIDAAAMPHV